MTVNEITLEKAKLYDYYNGDGDGFFHASTKHKKIITDNEFSIIANILQDLRFIQRKLASKEYEEQALKKIHELCDSEITVNFLKEIAVTKSY